MTLNDIVVNHLRVYGFDGMCCPDEECGCVAEDLAPCLRVNFERCFPGFKVANPAGGFFIRTEKPETAGEA